MKCKSCIDSKCYNPIHNIATHQITFSSAKENGVHLNELKEWPDKKVISGQR